MVIFHSYVSLPEGNWIISLFKLLFNHGTENTTATLNNPFSCIHHLHWKLNWSSLLLQNQIPSKNPCIQETWYYIYIYVYIYIYKYTNKYMYIHTIRNMYTYIYICTIYILYIDLYRLLCNMPVIEGEITSSSVETTAPRWATLLTCDAVVELVTDELNNQW